MAKFSIFFPLLCLVVYSLSASAEELNIVTSENTYTIADATQALDLRTEDAALEAAANLASLSQSEKVLFEQSRVLYLNKVAIILHKGRGFIGSLVSSAAFLKKVKDVLISRREELPEGEVGVIIRRLMQEEEERLAQLPAERKALKEKGREAIGGILNSVNRAFFKQAKLVASSDEIGVSAGVGLGANAGLGTLAAGGLAEVTFLFGINRKEKTFIFEIHGLLEKMKRTLTPLLIAGIDLRGGFYIKNSNVREIQKGESLFTPAIPTAFSAYPAHADTLLSSGIGFPPMATELMGYVSTSYRIPLLRVEVRFEPVLKFNVSLGFRRKKNTGFGISCIALFAD